MNYIFKCKYAVVNGSVYACCYRTVSYHNALVSNDVCKCRSYTHSAAVMGLIFLRGIHCFFPSYTWHVENEGLFVLMFTFSCKLLAPYLM